MVHAARPPPTAPCRRPPPWPLQEIGDGDSDLVVVHEALNFGHCHLALGVPNGGKFAGIDNMQQLRDMDCWTAETPLRVVTGGRARPHARPLGGLAAAAAAACGGAPTLPGAAVAPPPWARHPALPWPAQPATAPPPPPPTPSPPCFPRCHSTAQHPSPTRRLPLAPT